MSSRRGIRGASVLTVALALLWGGATPSSASAPDHSTSGSQPVPAAFGAATGSAKGSASGSAPAGTRETARTPETASPHGAGRGDLGLDIRARYVGGEARFSLKGAPSTTYAISFADQGDVEAARTEARVTTDAEGDGRVSTPLEIGKGRSGAVTLTASPAEDGGGARSSASLWVAPTRDGSFTTGTTSIEATAQAIVEDYPTGAQRQGAFEQLFVAPESSYDVTLAATSSAASVAVVTGKAQWTDWNGGTHPARHIGVKLNFAPGSVATTTDDQGNYRFEVPFSIPTNGASVTFLAESAAGRVGPLLDDGEVAVPFETYRQTVGLARDVPLGQTATVGITIGVADVTQTAFAVHDALWTAYLFGKQLGGEVEPVDIRYPGALPSEAFMGGAQGPGNIDPRLGIFLGEWEWSAWDVITHEYGHWYALRRNLTGLPWKEHCTEDNLATSVCNGGGAGKSQGGALAWSEGFASYFSISASEHDGHLPNIATVGDRVYDDRVTSANGVPLTNAQDDSFAFGADGREAVARGEDSEFAVSAVLLRLEANEPNSSSFYADSTALGPLRMGELLEDAHATRLSDFLAYVRPPAGDPRITARQVEDLGCLLASAEIAPYARVLQTSMYEVTVPRSDVSRPPKVEWTPGNKGNFRNDRFVVEVSEGPLVEPFLTAAPTTNTSWTPTGDQWTDIALRHGNVVYFRVIATQTDEPETGPFWGCATPHVLKPGAIVTSADCARVTLPPNDDGSTGAVNLPFPVNFFGTTYSHLYVNNNGNVTFQDPMWTYVPFQITANTPPIIAPFFADIDTRASGSAPVTYSYGATSFNGHRAFCVNWLNVGYFPLNADKLISAQLLLVDRADRAAGDMDIVFNYGSIQWESAGSGFGGISAAAGFSAGNGDENAFFQLPGSLENGAFIDGGPHALATNSYGGLTPGRYVFEVRNGAAGNSATGVVGHVTDLGRPVSGAPVQVCVPNGGRCVFQTRSGGDGSFSALGIPAGTYAVTAYPPAGVDARPRTVTVTVAQNQQTGANLEFATIRPVPNGVTVSPMLGPSSVPMLNWRTATKVRFAGCPDGEGTFQVFGEDGAPPVLASGGLTSDATAFFVATIPPLHPYKGQAVVKIRLECPSGVTRDIVFDVYIDPSGTVVDQAGHPVDGATVTLERSDQPEGPFEVVPDGSDVMSPANRVNPMTTGSDGHYGWDVVAGYYRLTAQREGCAGEDGEPVATSAVLAIPPPVTDLDLVLRCGSTGDVSPPVITTAPQRLEGNTSGGWSGDLPGVSVSDDTDAASSLGLVSDAPDVLPLGTTTVTWTATDAAGNESTATQEVSVVDTTAPRLTCPDDVSSVYVAAPALGRVTVEDVVDEHPVTGSNAPTSFGLGTTSVTWTATDASGNRTTCTQRVTLRLATTSTLALGDAHSLALLADGTVRAWGGGGNGQLGTGRTTSSSTPVAVPGLTDIRAVAAGGLFSLALKADGSVWAWGENSQGQLGDGTTTHRTTPKKVAGLPPVAAISAGRFHAVVVGIDGSVWAWGDNTFGQTGRSPSGRVLVPAQVNTSGAVTKASAGMYHSLALRADGTVVAWGAGYAGQLGDGTRVDNRPAVRVVPGLSGIVDVAAGGLHGLAVASSGEVFAWGDNKSGQLGDSSTAQRPSPVKVTALGAAASVAGGSDFSLVRLRDGSVWSFGENGRGQLGDGTKVNRTRPVRVTSVSNAAAVAAGAMHSAALTGTTLRSWGYNNSGQLGDATNTLRLQPVAVTGISTAAQPSALG